MSVSIDIEDSRWTSLMGIEALVARSVAIALPDDYKNHEVNVLLTTDEEIRILNKEWRGLDKPTNVLSFPTDPDAPQPTEEAPVLGDLALAYETIAAEAHAQNKSMVHHTAHLIVHGCLHLLGYDHDEDSDAAVMEAREIALLKTLEIADPYQI